MANLHILEFDKLEKDAKGNVVPIPRMPPVTDQRVVFTSAALSAAFQSKTKFVRLIADAACYVKFGSGPTAAETNSYIAANVAEYFSVISGQKVSAYDGST